MSASYETRLIREWQRTFGTIYGKRNRYQTSASGIVSQIGRELCLIDKTVDHDQPDNLQALAGLGARIFALANFLEEDLAFLLARKYPLKCPYCGKPAQCNCRLGARAAEKQFATPHTAQHIAATWGLDDAQRMFARLYGAANAEDGRSAVFRHLSSEHLEINKALAERDVPELQEELADLFAWWLGYGTLRDIPSMSSLLYEFYPDVCSRCRQSPCAVSGPCPPF